MGGPHTVIDAPVQEESAHEKRLEASKMDSKQAQAAATAENRALKLQLQVSPGLSQIKAE